MPVMQLAFPAGELPQTLLYPGTLRVGATPGAEIPLKGTDILPDHAELLVSPQGVMLKIAKGAAVTVNLRQVEGLISLRAGDQIAFGEVRATLVAVPQSAAVERGAQAPAIDDIGATTVRVALPKYALRVQSGRMLGKTLPIAGATIVGRAPECQLRIEDGSLSRKHARLVPTQDGIVVEDLGSTNGTFHNGKRVQNAVAKPGDEIGFDTLRFRLIELGQAGAGLAMSTGADAGSAGVPRWVWLAGGIVAVAVLLFVLL